MDWAPRSASCSCRKEAHGCEVRLDGKRNSRDRWTCSDLLESLEQRSRRQLYGGGDVQPDEGLGASRGVWSFPRWAESGGAESELPLLRRAAGWEVSDQSSQIGRASCREMV